MWRCDGPLARNCFTSYANARGIFLVRRSLSDACLSSMVKSYRFVSRPTVRFKSFSRYVHADL